MADSTAPAVVPARRTTTDLPVIGAWLGLAMGLVSLVVVVGWIAGLPRLVDWGGSTLIQGNAALGLAACGVSLASLARGRLGTAAGGAVAAIVIGGLTFLEHVAGGDFGIDRLLFSGDADRELLAGRMPAVSALEMALSGAALLVLTKGRATGLRFSVAGALGAMVTALALVDLMVLVTGLLGTLRGGLLLGGAVPEVLAYLLLGAWTAYYAWQRDAAAPTLPQWVPVATGLAFLVATVFVWRALVSEQNAQLAARMEARSREVRREISEQLLAHSRTLEQLARRTASHHSIQLWLADAPVIFEALIGATAMAWVDSTGTMRVAVPGRIALPVSLVRGPTGTRGTDTTATVVRDPLGDGRHFALSAPVCQHGQCVGRVVALYETASFLAGAFATGPNEDLVRAATSAGEIFRTRMTSASEESGGGGVEFTVESLGWRITVVASDATRQVMRSTLPEVLLGLGLAVSVLFTITLRLAQTSWVRAREFERQRLLGDLESATDGVWEWDRETGVAERSRSIWRRLGYNPDEMPSTPNAWSDLIHPDDLARYQAALSEHLAGRSPSFDVEYRVLSRAGEWHWVVDHGRVVERNSAGEPQRLLGLLGDVTERKRADAGLAESERRFRAIFDSAYQYEALLDINGRLLEANRAALEFSGVSLSDVRGLPLWETPWWRGSPDRMTRLQGAFEEARQGRVVHYEDEIAGAGDRRAIIDFSVKPILDDDGRVSQILAEGRDITDRRRNEAVMREMDTLATMGRLAARVAHEINNPLAGIQNSFLLIKDAVPVNHPYYNYVGAIEREINRIATVTRELYETYRHGQDASRESSVQRIMSDAVALLSQVNRAKGVTIRTDASRAPTVIPVPEAIVRQIMFNLIQNAVDASPEGATVQVAAWTEEQRFRVLVRDEGAGVPEALRERIFEPFFSTKSGMRTGGMGLGLSLVKRSVEAVGGRIWLADSPPPGAQFEVELPLTPIEFTRGP